MFLKGKFLLQKADNKADATVRKRVVGTSIGAVASVLNNVSEAVVGGGKSELGELLQVEGSIVG